MDLVSHEFHLGTILEIRGDFSLAFQVLGGKLDTFQRLTFRIGHGAIGKRDATTTLKNRSIGRDGKNITRFDSRFSRFYVFLYIYIYTYTYPYRGGSVGRSGLTNAP